MRASEFKRRSNIAAWKKEIESYQCSGLSLRDWCIENDMTQQQYYYRLRRVREFLIDEIESRSAAVSLVRYSVPDDKESRKACKAAPPSDGRIEIKFGELKASFPETTDISIIVRFMRELAQ